MLYVHANAQLPAQQSRPFICASIHNLFLFLIPSACQFYLCVFLMLFYSHMNLFFLLLLLQMANFQARDAVNFPYLLNFFLHFHFIDESE